jgi:hypothetical protein
MSAAAPFRSVTGAGWSRWLALRRRPSRYCGMAKKPPESPKPATWTIYKIAAKQERLGTVEAPDEASAMEKAAAEFGVLAKRLMAVRR